MSAIYDNIGDSYSRTRFADKRIVDRIVQLLELPVGASILDVGAGTGNYSTALAERGYAVTALEPSAVMSSQASDFPQVTWSEASAEKMPFDTSSFDAAILILCIHHFSELQEAMQEVQRVTRSNRILIFSYDPSAIDEPWLFDYFPAFREAIKRAFPSVEQITSCFEGAVSVEAHPFLLPHDLMDSFAGAGWRYPEKYLEKEFRDGTSAFRQLDSKSAELGLARLKDDLETGEWDRKYPEIRKLTEFEHGYIFVLARQKPSASAKINDLPDAPKSLFYGDVAVEFDQLTEGNEELGFVPGYRFCIYNKQREEVGHLNFRVGNTDHVQFAAGHVGYEILEVHRGNGYAAQACFALAPWIAEFQQEILITVDPDNVPSIRTIEKIGAVFIDEVAVPKGDPHFQRGSLRKKRYRWNPTSGSQRTPLKS